MMPIIIITIIIISIIIVIMVIITFIIDIIITTRCTIIIVLIMIDLRYDVMNPHNLYSLLVEKLLVHETGQKLTKNQNDRNTHIKIITNMHKCKTSDVILP